MSIPVILGSTSLSRRTLLTQAGICPTIRPSGVDEPAALAHAAARAGVSVADLPAQQRVMILAQAKAQAVYAAYRTEARVVKQAECSSDRIYIDRPYARDGQSRSSDQALGGSDGWLAQHPGLNSLARGPIIIGADSLFEMDGHICGKPHTRERARERLRQMSGKRGTLWTGHCVIDMKTGKQQVAVSSAQVQCATLSDAEIDRYIDTGEPLNVAGSFTLEGLGGAFIDTVVGDPHGVIGLSLPLLRHMCARLSIEWTDLWNVSYDSHGKGFVNGDHRAPLSFVTQPGDGWFDCVCGHRHWGLFGGAGILLVRCTPEGKLTHMALQHRVSWSLEGGTWGTPGGALSQTENPLEGALRESFEEASIDPADIEVWGAHEESHGEWAYTTFFAGEKPGHHVEPHVGDNESTAVQWIPIDRVSQLPLLSYFGHDWPRYVKTLQRLAAEHAQS
jgi:septum formation protein